MAKAKFYAEIDTHWQGQDSIFIGPFETREATETAVRASDASRADLGQMAADVRFGTVCRGIRNTAESRKAGMKTPATDFSNVAPPAWGIPNNTSEFEEIVTALYN